MDNAKQTQSAPISSTSTTMAYLQRQNRETAQRRKKLAMRIAGGFAIGLHAIGIIVGAIYFVKKTVLDPNKDKVESVVLEASKPEAKRRTPPRVTRQPKKPKFSKIRAPKGQPITTNAKIPVGNATFTLPASAVPSRPVMAPSTAGIGRNLFRGSQQTNIVTTMPKFEVPKFENTSLVARLDMETNLAQTEFNDSGNLELTSVNLGDAKQSFNEFLQAVRDRIKQVQRFPPRVRNLEDGSTTTIRFTLFNDGTVRNPEVFISSGSHALDNAALAAVRNAVPYPPFPEGQEGLSLRLEIPIIFELAN
ncbi:MAG: TonB family protein [Candidatus Poribacteria bacterium]|nr:TonB family protein [Candidatus Poribacteria bacterium]